VAQQPTSITDPRALRAMAHPVRLRILEELETRRSARAADIAKALDIPANQASFHLRQLAKYDFVEEAPEEARDGRDRVWRVVHGVLQIDAPALLETSAGRAALATLKRSMAEQIQLMLERSARRRPGDDTGHFSESWSTLRLTDEEARTLRDELADVVERWTERSRDSTDPDARMYSLVRLLQPSDVSDGD